MDQRGKIPPADSRSAAALLRWYDENRRDLPWRRQRDPYAILVSEIMLQQTRVETVLPFYRRFLQRFPTVKKLARAPRDRVLAAWSGLGYYRRARLLHRAARQIDAAGGRFPVTLEGLLALPGVGRYTAAALASIALGVVVPAVDGNVARVVARLGGIDGDPRRAAIRRRVEAGARRLLDPARPGDSNQALMELGATVCWPRAPRCPLCPLAHTCAAAASGEPELIPAPRRRPAGVKVRLRLAVVRKGGRVLLFRRPEDSRLLAGLWDLPWVEGRDGAASAEAFAKRYGGRWHLGRSLGTVRHAITHRDIEAEVLEAEIEAGAQVSEGREARWVEPRRLRDLPLSSLVWKALRGAGLEGS